MTRSGPADWAALSQQDDLSDDDVAAITKRLQRLERDGPWTLRVLELIRDNPEVVSTTLAAEFHMERFAFKKLVYKLKRLGLTHSLEVGYRLSPRGTAYLAKR